MKKRSTNSSKKSARKFYRTIGRILQKFWPDPRKMSKAALVIQIALGLDGWVLADNANDNIKKYTPAAKSEINNSADKQDPPSNKEKSSQGSREKKDNSKNEEEQKDPTEEKPISPHEAIIKGKFGETLGLKNFRINFGDATDEYFISFEIFLEYSGKQAQKKEILAKKAKIRDRIISLFGQWNKKKIMDFDGKDELRLTILNDLNSFLDIPLTSIYITNLLFE